MAYATSLDGYGVPVAGSSRKPCRIFQKTKRATPETRRGPLRAACPRAPTTSPFRRAFHRSSSWWTSRRHAGSRRRDLCGRAGSGSNHTFDFSAELRHDDEATRRPPAHRRRHELDPRGGPMFCSPVSSPKSISATCPSSGRVVDRSTQVCASGGASPVRHGSWARRVTTAFSQSRRSATT
jgi:hypothetical protein